ncbi:hypothetical protein DIT71_12835 [Marinobacter vulgaris]|uniref:DUF1269 domain-containing protein n=1 Tax=Marinobacter vulgaris TaxID=1928331 RepID=A0A2V3ZJ56_9GAMM|nr:hypothetical protein [Marinobacter vulgaris]PXX90370.1 hypothetical protein DIT71_12835 [Marinobacter vulgaris]TSJ69603.1 hypothetical protein FPC41_11810 [Marinobacter vulgaris]
MNSSANLTGEKEDHKVAAVFDTEPDARGTAKAICEETSLTDEQVTVLSPNDRHQGKELEPEDQGIWRTLVRSHIGLGIAGAVAGFVLFLILSALGVGFIAQNTVVAASVMTVIAAAIGMLVAGAVTLRPDHTPYLMKAQAALSEGKYVLAVHASSLEQLQEAKSLLDARNVKTMPTI